MSKEDADNNSQIVENFISYLQNFIIEFEKNTLEQCFVSLENLCESDNDKLSKDHNSVIKNIVNEMKDDKSFRS
tara:strand:+ start:149 stop:370 length:222 start_codon:yes stop_codon:yes gene_type:complete